MDRSNRQGDGAVFKRRIGLDPHRGGTSTSGSSGCPDVWELTDGTFAIIGAERTSALRAHLPPSANCGPDESIVVVPRALLTHVRKFIPKS